LTTPQHYILDLKPIFNSQTPTPFKLLLKLKNFCSNTFVYTSQNLSYKTLLRNYNLKGVEGQKI